MADFWSQLEGLDPGFTSSHHGNDDPWAKSAVQESIVREVPAADTVAPKTQSSTQEIDDDGASSLTCLDDEEFDGFPASQNSDTSPHSEASDNRILNEEPVDDSGEAMNVSADVENQESSASRTNGSSSSPARNGTPKLDAVATHSPNGAKRRLDAEPTGNSVGAVPSMSSFVERMHRVEEHIELPKKKAKMSDDEDDEDKKKTHMNGMTKGGPIGEYMNEKGKEAAANQATQNQPIDLTLDDDDEVIVVSDKMDRIVCLGRLANARVNGSLVPTPKMGQFQGSSTMWPIMKCGLQREKDSTCIIKVMDPTVRHIGNLDFETARGLAPLMDAVWKNGIRVATKLAPRKRQPGEVTGMPTSSHFEIIVVLYAPRKHAKAIGTFLKSQNQRLDNPTPGMVDRGYEVENPHAPPKPNNPLPAVAQTGVYGSSSGPSAGFVMRTVEQVRDEVAGMFDTLANTEELPEKEQDSRVTTQLLSHQKQALFFMSELEKDRGYKDAADESEGFSLWRVKHGGHLQTTFYNVITGHETHSRPPPVLGGILADMMGLGKTLSILSLIVGSLADAESFSLCSPPRSPQQMLLRNLKGTLLVAPMSTIQNWEEQISAHIAPGTLSVYVYHGPKRTADHHEIAKHDIVITSYGTLMSEFSKAGTKKPIFNCQWFRLVLDEAHIIRQQSTGQFAACHNVIAERRWAVTGTPVQNRLEDLGALIKFLRIKPFDEKTGFNNFIIQPFKNADPEILPKLQLLVNSITLRRLKDKIDLPARHDLIIRLDFSEAEQRLYGFFLADSTRRVKAISGREKLGGKSYAHVLKAILRLRLICAHGQELLSEDDLKMTQGISASNAIELGDDDDEEKPALTQKQAFEMFYLLRESDLDRCDKCSCLIGRRELMAHNAESSGSSSDDEGTSSGVVGHMTACYHLICPKCIDEFSDEVAERVDLMNPTYMTCPRCKQYVRTDFFKVKQSELDEDARAKERVRQNPKLAKQLGRYLGPHTKTKALMEELRKHREWSNAHPEEPPIKSVIFSGWTSHLDLIQLALEANSISYTRLDGSMSRKARTNAIDTFREDPNVPTMIVSINAGGLGLNLTAGSKVFVMEPQFNPAAEAQAVDRVHRLGQRREVTIMRFIMRDSFEEKMLLLQRKKMDLADLSMSKTRISKVDMAKQRLEELRSLFR